MLRKQRNNLCIGIVVLLSAWMSSAVVGAEVSDRGEVTISSGSWTEKGYAIRGEWKIVERNGSNILMFDDRFKTRKGPDLKVFLSSTPISELNDRNAVASSVSIGTLKSHKGAQEYPIPESIDLTEFSSMIIHCEAYSHLWGGSPLDKQ